MQHGGCHPVDQCQGPHPFAGAKFRYLAASTFEKSSGKTVFPPYEIREFDGIPVAFIGLTLKGTPGLVSPTGVADLEFRDEAEYGERADPGTEGARRRGHRRPDPRRRIADGRLQRMPRRFGPDRRHRQEVRQGGRRRGHRPHPPGLCLRDRRAARHVRRQIRHARHRDRSQARSRRRATSSAPKPTTPSSAPQRSQRTPGKPR